LAWIADDAKKDTATPTGANADFGAENPWLAVARKFPGTEFAKAAQRNAGVPVTTRTPEDSAEALYREAEILWMDQANVSGAIAQYRQISARRNTTAGRRSLWAVAWLADNFLHDTATAAKAYRLVVDSLPNTAWARRADAILKGQPHDFLEGTTASHAIEDDFVEGVEKIDSTRYQLGPRRPRPSGLLAPDEPEAIPPKPEDQLLTPDDFQ
jgi:hypothetical protein